jgi:predicted AAA+ superfamily ATPase
MPHVRKRHLQNLFDKLVKFSPIVGLFGHRQTGKSTWISSLYRQYFTLDDEKTLNKVKEDPVGFISENKKNTCVIDECQFEPRLFPALKEHVRTNKRPGQFVLTGSVRFSSRRAIRESLAGRMASIEMYPLTVSELMGLPLPETISLLCEEREFSEKTLLKLGLFSTQSNLQKNIEKYLECGGLPGLCFIREERLQKELLFDLHNLILDRDLRLIVETKLSLETLRRFLQFIARNSFSPHNAAAAKRELGLAHQTQESLIFALESIFLIRSVRIMDSPKRIFLLEDQLEEKILSEGTLSLKTQWMSCLYRNIRSQFGYRLGTDVEFQSYATRSGAEVPLVVSSNGQFLGFIVLNEESPTLSESRSADSFLRRYSNSKVVFVRTKKGPSKWIDRRALIVSAVNLVC